MGPSTSFMKLLLVTFCALFLIAGIAIIAVSIWSIADKIFLSHIIGSDLITVASYFLLIGGIVVVASAIVGLVASIRKNRILLIVFFVLLLLIFLLLLIGAIMAAVFQGELEEQMQNSMAESLQQKYGARGSENAAATAAWDKVQKDLRCCAVRGSDWKLYQSTAFFMEQQNYRRKKYVPETCCVYDERIGDYTDVAKCQNFGMGPPNNLLSNIRNQFLYYNGCYSSAKTFLQDHSGILMAIGFVFSISMISGLVLTIFYFRRVVGDEDAERKHRYTEDDAAVEERENERL
ncbi:CD151 antigen-like [Haliotis cracherodii]|uniref:CD151 antigen-like n=1 Tax=Haliotis cracherodii TaxID=6455 RepID=UPI0039E82ADF